MNNNQQMMKIMNYGSHIENTFLQETSKYTTEIQYYVITLLQI